MRKKVDIQETEVDIQELKVDIQGIFADRLSGFSAKTVDHICILFDQYGFDNVFGRSNVVELFDIQNSSASKFLAKLVQAEIIDSVSGYRKGRYHFRK